MYNDAMLAVADGFVLLSISLAAAAAK